MATFSPRHVVFLCLPILLITTGHVTGYGKGAPKNACEQPGGYMVPGHRQAVDKTKYIQVTTESDDAYTLEFNANTKNYNPGDEIQG